MRELDIIFEDGAQPEPHELQTGLFLRKSGRVVKFLAPKNLNGVKTPDILMDGLLWEIKSPVSAGSRTIEHALRSASKQSVNVIFDLRRFKASDEKALRQINFTAKKRTAIKKLLIVTKSEKLIDFK